MGDTDLLRSQNRKPFVNNDYVFDVYPLRDEPQQEEEKKAMNPFATDLSSGKNPIADDALVQQ